MDILFSPPNIGALPSSAMAEVEIKTEAMRSSSLQQMLDLERKYKMDRLLSAPASPPASPPPPSEAQGLGRPPLQVRRADSLSRQQNFLMLKAARRSTAPPPLSITIPEPPASGRDHDLSRRGQLSDPQQEEKEEEDDDDDDDTETETTAEPLHKQVKFLAPDNEDEDDMSDQSSICQSPSWEGYGQRKKEKKKEAERRKKEKEQAEKDAKAAKKRPASRLSKAPPPTTLSRNNSSLVGIANTERSMSDPLLATAFHSSVESRLARRPQNDDRASSANDLQHGRTPKHTETENLGSPAKPPKGFLGGVKSEKEKANTIQNCQTSVYPPSLPYQLIQTSGPEPKKVGSLSPTMPAVRQDGRSPRESAFPPSSSRTPMLRHMSGSGHGRSNSLLLGAANFFRGQDGKSHGDPETFSATEGPSHNGSGDNERGRDQEQGRHERPRSTSRTMSVEHTRVDDSRHSSSTRSSSRSTRHARRSSISQEAKTMAMKISGLKLTPSAKDEHAAYGGKDPNQVDYFNFMERSYSTSVLSAMVSGGGPATRPTTRETFRQSNNDSASARETKAQKQDGPTTHEPAPSSRQSSLKESSIANSATSGQGKKGRSLRDAAKAALHIGTTTTTKPAVSVPPYLAFRTRMQSHTSNSGDKKQPSAHSEQVPAPISAPPAAANTTTSSQDYIPISTESSSGQPSSSSSVKITELETQAGSRASEGSSSTSSAYEDGSPLPSPNTTPDTSRPQSSKDMPLHSEDPAEVKGRSAIQDDEITLRQSSESSESSNSSTTPRLAGSAEVQSSETTNDDRWSRTALPLDIDGEVDAQSFKTSFSHQEDTEDDTIKATLGRKDATQSHAEILNSLKMSVTQPKLVKSMSDPALRIAESESGTPDMFLPDLEKPVAIPARSKRRISPVESQGGGRPRGADLKQALEDSQRSGDSQREERETTRSSRVRNGDRSAETPVVPRTESHAAVYSELDLRPMEETAVRESKREKRGGRRRHRERDQPAHDGRAEPEPGRGTPNGQDIQQARLFASTQTSSPSMTRQSTSSSLASSNSSGQSLKSPRNATFPHSGPQQSSQHSIEPHARSSPAGSRVSTPEPAAAPSKPPGPVRVASDPTPTTQSSSMLPVAPLGPSASRPAGPVSILKQPTRSTSDPAQGAASPASSSRLQPPHVLSALPKHMQLQAGISARPPPGSPESRMAPIAKMFVECCSCKFYHDMPSKLYECMAKPDAVIEDRTLGISGAITTMVKCPWCQHNMSTSCCAGYAAVVYLKEKLH